MAAALGFDAENHVGDAVNTRDTWSGLTLAWPVDDSSDRLTVELSGLPIFDRDRAFRGYRGFGVCRDIAGLNALARARHGAKLSPTPPPDHRAAAATLESPRASVPANPDSIAGGENIVPFARPVLPQPETPSLTPVERRAFRELTRRLTARLTESGVEYPGANDHDLPSDDPTLTDLAEAAKAATASPPEPGSPPAAHALDDELFQPEPPPLPQDAAPSASAAAPIPILDRLPVGVLVYRHSELLYANRAFLTFTGYDDLTTLIEEGGLDSLFVGPDATAADHAGGKPFALAGRGGDQLAVEGRLIVVPWEGDSAFALVTTPLARPASAPAAPEPAQSEAAELRSILDTATDGVITLDADGRILSASRSAEALFGHEARDLIGRAFTGLFAPESEQVAADYLERLKKNGVASVLNDGREVIGRVREGGLIPLFMTLGRIGEHAQKFCAVLRDITPWKKAEEELIESKRRSEKSSAAKADFLAKVSHEVRTPLNERFGPVGNDRYRQYLRDIHAAGHQVIALVDDLLALSKIEAGTLELAFTSVALNELIQQCVAALQPQANKERIIIRTSLPPKLPPVVADEGAMRQIVTNLLTHSINLSAAGGQIIVSTALTDAGEVALRVRDTGIGMSETEIANALDPFRSLAVSGRWGNTGLGLPLSKALAEANRASFRIRSKPKEGTLVEVTFPATRVLAG
jgi:PAS domain S-box-containing protein